ncbi:hypothetical protein BY458DRAFT_472326 [Sporodiniella umbellata]|nr:hypothetical protein BY458DRAFT_472326 [Sporodiniella umbellata]
MAAEKKLTKREQKALAFKKRGKKEEFSEETAVPEADVEPEVKASEEKTTDRKRKSEGNEDKKAVSINVPKEGEPALKKKRGDKPAESRYIIFVGNLPFNTTKEELEKHFESVETIKSTRLMTDKATGKPKGFAFMEFENSKELNKALAFHHTFFKKRQINVELTAGGGGNKSGARKEKLLEKNKRLTEERAKKHEKIKNTNIQQSSYKIDE